MFRFMFVFVLAGSVWCVPGLVFSESIPITAKSAVRCVSKGVGEKFLRTSDAFTKSLQPFERQVRLQSTQSVDEEMLLRFVADQVLDWKPDEQERVEAMLKEISKRAHAWPLPFPKDVQLIQTTGEDEGGGAYCRGNAIVLPNDIVSKGGTRLRNILTHELFHILSRHNLDLQDQLYRIVGFQKCPALELPETWRARRLTNPDAPFLEHYVSLKHNDGEINVIPLTLSKTAEYKTGSLFEHLDFKLMQVDIDKTATKPILVDQQPVVFDPSELPDYFRRIGRNTGYIIHPEEVLADNFVYLIWDKKPLKDPWVVEQMRAAFDSLKH